MDMYAYIFITSSKKYLTVKGSTIENFWYETPGRQSKTFSSKPFKYSGKTSKNGVVCQILIVAATVKELNELIAKRRIAVPKLNNSDLQLPEDTTESEAEKVRKSRSNLKKVMTNSINKTNSKIIDAHSSFAKSHAEGNANEPKEPLKKKVYDHDSNAGNNTDTDLTNSEEEHNTANKNISEDEDLFENEDLPEHPHDSLNNPDNMSSVHNANDNINYSDNEISDVQRNIERQNLNSSIAQQENESTATNEPTYNNNMYARLMEENKNLKLQVAKLRSGKIASDRLSRMLQAKCDSYKKTINNKNKDSENIQMKLKPKGLPSPVCCTSGVYVRADALEDAYTKTKPSVFYEHMCYLTWGRRTLAKRCIKKTKKTPENCKVLTPRKKRVVRKHFINYLKYYKYHSVLFNKEINSINEYAHRAIVCSKRYLSLVNEYPQLASDEEAEENIDIQMVEL